ncbi:MAG: YegS/Rv2252/BmrU family lipid kinase [Flavobacterium sp.]|nr:MAG: YegS/Rv2252/BmrU family lipid kinase [Flavobacterium sp.]
MSPEKSVIMVVNPISGDRDKAEFTMAAQTYAEAAGINLTIYETTGEDDIDKIARLYEKQKPQRVLVAGGDGTIKMVADALEKQDVILGILPAGSANGLSVDLGFPTTIAENVHIAFENDFMEIDMVCINSHKSLHLSDLGLNAEMIRNYENSTIRGKIGYVLQGVTTLADAPVQFTAEITANGETISTEAKMIVIANSQKYGTGVVINPKGKMNDGKFEIVVLRNLDLLLVGKIVTGNMPLDSEDVEIISCESATIRTDIPVHFQIDGEYVGEEQSLDIRILPRQMKVAVPTAI